MLLPLQSAVPLPSGAWPAGAASRRALLEQANAEIQFAFEELGPEAADWHTPQEIVDLAERNPTLDVEPQRVAASLLRGTTRGDRIPSPLHGQLRRISALFDTRYMMIPLSLGYEVDPATGESDADTSSAPDTAPDTPPDTAPADTSPGPAAPEERSTGRAALDLALVDIRRGVVMWRGTLYGEPAPRDSPALLATLAARLAEGAAP